MAQQRRLPALVLALAVAAAGQARADDGPLTLTPDGRAHLRLDVMTYNIEGLHWPARQGRAAELAEIGRRLAELRQAGQAPDVILFQEMFSPAARRAVRAAGYPDEVSGPSRHARRALPADGHVPRHDWRDGEWGVRFVSGGLAIVSRYPVTAHWAQPFSRRSCAGFDCLSNKGALFARIAVPGAPDPIELFDSHLNSRRSSGAAPRRTLVAHRVEAHELADFIAAAHDPAAPAILAGDFNMRRSAARFAAFEPLQPLTLVQRYCLKADDRCAAELPGEAPWLSTEDLQFFRSGARVEVRPVRMGAMFDGQAGGPVLSDHSAVRVVYDLSWDAGGRNSVSSPAITSSIS
jgi:endonuclease/exonuclease/phosphatase family metal-dependent hydrolase